jgi:hypothetical protein
MLVLEQRMNAKRVRPSHSKANAGRKEKKREAASWLLLQRRIVVVVSLKMRFS